MKWKANIYICECFHVAYCFKPALYVQPECRILKCVYIYLHIVYLRNDIFFSSCAQNSRVFTSICNTLACVCSFKIIICFTYKNY